MMSPGHAMSGAASGYTTCLIYSVATGYQWPWVIPHIIAGIVAGWALWCDCDTRGSTVSTSLGWITQRGLHPAICYLCAAIYFATRTQADPGKKPRIHRGATHTWPGALVMGALVAGLCLIWPRYAIPTVLTISLHWALRGLTIPRSPYGKPRGNVAGRFITTRAYMFLRLVPQPGRIFNRIVRRASRWLGFSGKWVRTSSLVICGIVSWVATESAPELHQVPIILALGGFVTQGCLVHMLGDSVTESGICWKFPVIDKASGKRWHESKIPSITIPAWVPKFAGRVYKPAFKTGRAFEVAVMYPLCIAACVLAAPGGWALLGHMGELTTAWRHMAVMSAALPFSSWPRTVKTLPAQ
jgi:hypothetical protein